MAKTTQELHQMWSDVLTNSGLTKAQQKKAAHVAAEASLVIWHNKQKLEQAATKPEAAQIIAVAIALLAVTAQEDVEVQHGY